MGLAAPSNIGAYQSATAPGAMPLAPSGIGQTAFGQAPPMGAPPQFAPPMMGMMHPTGPATTDFGAFRAPPGGPSVPPSGPPRSGPSFPLRAAMMKGIGGRQ